jgi:hypothetical protein
LVNKNTVFDFKKTKSDHITCEVNNGHQKVLLHSTYAPVKEAQRFIASHLGHIKDKKKIIIYGLGCGYHIAELLQAVTSQDIKIEVWDFNTDYYNFVKHEKFLQNLLNDDRVSIHVSGEKKSILKIWQRFNPENDYLIIHPASLRIMPESLHEMQDVLEIFQTNVGNMHLVKDTLKENFAGNINQANIDDKGLFNGLLNNIPMVLVAAGPSLTKNLVLLKEYRKKIFIGCVGTALEPLLKAGIYPDFFMLTDSLESLSNQFSQIDRSTQQLIPLFYLGTVAPSVVSRYAGPKIMLLQAALEEAKKVAENLNVVTVKTGGSVATTLLDWMVHLGAKQICFVGQDLAYTNSETHVTGTACYTKVSEKRLQGLLEIDDYFLMGKVYAPRNLYIYKKWIENYICQHHDISFFNATQGGAHIYGCQHVKFEEFIEKISFRNDIEKYRTKFIRTIKKIVETTYRFAE